MNMPTCNICFKKTKLENFGECSHKFCSKCISNWMKINNTCPFCRMISTKNKKINYQLGQCYGLQVTPEKYLNEWKYKECLENSHSLLITKPYGVHIRCLDCNNMQGFNWVN
jgi:hypothetical protein